MGVINKTTSEINTLLDKVQNMPDGGTAGKTLVLETGTTTTLDPGSQATSEVVAAGTDSDGNPKYRLNFGIPQGQPGSGGSGGGTADSVAWENVTGKPSWVDSSVKPAYTATEVGALPASTVIPDKTSQLDNDSGFVKSGELKTVNGQSLTGGGNIEIAGSGGGITDAPSDGKTYARKDGNWTAFTAGGATDITAIYNRLGSLGEDDACTEEDYNALMQLATNGTPAYVNLNTEVFPVTLYMLNDVVCLSMSIYFVYQLMSATMYIDSSSRKIAAYDCQVPSMEYFGEGKLGSYSKPSAYSAIEETDTLAKAIGKLEAGLADAGGTDDSVYYLSEKLINLDADSTWDDIWKAFGGDDGVAEFVNEVCINGKKAYIRNYTSGVLVGIRNIPVSCSFVNLSSPVVCATLSFMYPDSLISDGNAIIKQVFFVTNKSAKGIKKIYTNGYKLSKSVCDLTTDSTSDEISSALGGIDGVKKLAQAIKDGNSVYITSSDMTASRYSLSCSVREENDDYYIGITGLPEAPFLTYIGLKFLIIKYTASSNTFVCSNGNFGYEINDNQS